MSSSTTLLIGLTDVARLADVQRPVVSMWRSRHATGQDPFPAPVNQKDGRPLFDAIDVARWLERTEHGNNPDVVADAAAASAPAGFDTTDAEHIDIIDALLALRTVTGRSVGGASLTVLAERARAVDPADEYLRSEIERAPLDWAAWADVLADAAYSSARAARIIEKRHAATRSSAGSAGPLTPQGDELLVTLTSALFSDACLHLGPDIEPALAMALLRSVGEDAEVELPAVVSGRRIRRRFACESTPALSPSPTLRAPALHLVRLPADTGAAFRQADELALSLGPDDRAIIMAPAAVLTDALTGEQDLARTTVLRSGRVRAVARLGAGLVVSAPREALGVWVLGPAVGEVPIADRFTAVADLTDIALTPAACTDLTSDVLAAMGSARDVRAHAFRFARLVRTTSLLASRGSLVAGASKHARRSDPGAQDLPAMIDFARGALGDDAPQAMPVPSGNRPASAARLDALLAEKHLRVVAGTRVDANEFTGEGLVAVTADDLDDAARIGRRRIDPLDFAARHPSARLTMPGDVVFRTAPTPLAWLDVEGSKVVVYPARVLRIDSADPGGLMSELIVADIAHAHGGAGTWRRWMLRRVPPKSIVPLRSALNDLAARRADLIRRIEALDTYSDLLTSGVVSGAVTLTDHAADAASNSQ